MAVMTIQVSEDGSLVLPREASRRLGLAPDLEVVVAVVRGGSDGHCEDQTPTGWDVGTALRKKVRNDG